MNRPGLNCINDSLHATVEACEECLLACEVCANQYMGDAEHEDLVRACRDAADLCALSLRFMARQAELTPELCEVCAKACQDCADECEELDDAIAATCEAACRRCAEACLAVAV